MSVNGAMLVFCFILNELHFFADEMKRRRDFYAEHPSVDGKCLNPLLIIKNSHVTVIKISSDKYHILLKKYFLKEP